MSDMIVWECSAGHRWTASRVNPDGTVNRYQTCIAIVNRWTGEMCPYDGHPVEEVRARTTPVEKPQYAGFDIAGWPVPANETARNKLHGGRR